MAQTYAYNFARIDPITRMCVEIVSETTPGMTDPENWVEIPVYDEGYLFKYYINGNWYEDAAGTIPWTSSLL